MQKSTILDSENLPKLSNKQLCRDMDLILITERAGHAFSLMKLHVQLGSSHFLGTCGTIENPTLVSAVINERVVGCGGGNGDAEHVPQQFHGKEGFLDRCGECDQIFKLACVTHGLLGNAEIDLVALDVNEAGMRLRLRITSCSEAGERLRSRVTNWSGKTCTARHALTPRPGRGNLGGSHGCHELPHSAICALLLLVLCKVCCWLRCKQMRCGDRCRDRATRT